MGLFGLEEKIATLKIKLELKKKKCVTFNYRKRAKGCISYYFHIECLSAAKKHCVADDQEIIEIRNDIIKLNGDLAKAVMGLECMYETKQGTYAYSPFLTKLSVRNLLEMGANGFATIVAAFHDDDMDDLVRMTINGLDPKLNGTDQELYLIPVLFDGSRQDLRLPDVNSVFINMSEIYDQTFSIGELATIYSWQPDSDVIAMLINAETDFSVRTNENPKGMPAFVYVFQNNFKNKMPWNDAYINENTQEWRKEIVDTYKEVYLNKNNMVEDGKREEIFKMMQNCVDDEHPYAKNISNEDKAMIRDALKEMSHEDIKDEEKEK